MEVMTAFRWFTFGFGIPSLRFEPNQCGCDPGDYGQPYAIVAAGDDADQAFLFRREEAVPDQTYEAERLIRLETDVQLLPKGALLGGPAYPSFHELERNLRQPP